jgi:hypothetical protein
MILAHEKNVYKDDCYVPNYNLSNSHLERSRPNVNFANYFGKRVLVNWAMFSSPQHFILQHLLNNVVDMIKHEYLRLFKYTVYCTYYN